LGGIKRVDKDFFKLLNFCSCRKQGVRKSLFIAKTGDNFLELKINHSRFGNPVGPRELEIIIIQRNGSKIESSIPQKKFSKILKLE